MHFALAQLGKPYGWGGNGPDAYDCSGLTQQSWRAAGVWIPRKSQDQARTGTAVSPRLAQPGDIVIFYANDSHAGLYLGDGLVIVSSHPGSRIQIMPMAWMPVSTIRRIA